MESKELGNCECGAPLADGGTVGVYCTRGIECPVVQQILTSSQRYPPSKLMTGDFDVPDKIRESLRIERIYREPNNHEIEEYERFMALREIAVHDLRVFVGVYQPGHVLREKPGKNIIVGSRICPEGGPQIRTDLQFLLNMLNKGHITPWMFHAEYEMLHPFTDCNGRSGRMLWYWQMSAQSLSTRLGFLHTYYYQTLEKHGRDMTLWNKGT